MTWNIEFTVTAEKQLKKIDRKWQLKILNYLEDQIAVLDDPKSRGKALINNKKGFWRYRIGDYRIICHILDRDVIIVVVTLGHRKKVYID